MNELQAGMRDRWNEKGWSYDQAGAHGVHSDDARNQWTRLFQQDGRAALNMLDVGTGTGFVALLAAALGHRVTAIDWSETMLDQAKAKAQEQQLTVQFAQGMTESLPFEDGRFQLVTARHVVWTLSEPEQAFAEWHRVLKPGGLVWADYSPRSGEHGSRHYSDEIEERLPLNRDVPPQDIAQMFVRAGFGRCNFYAAENGHRVTYFFICEK